MLLKSNFSGTVEKGDNKTCIELMLTFFYSLFDSLIIYASRETFTRLSIKKLNFHALSILTYLLKIVHAFLLVEISEQKVSFFGGSMYDNKTLKETYTL